MAYHLKEEGHRLHLIAVDYGQRHRKELDCARIAAERLGAPFELADLSAARNIMRGSSLTDSRVDVPKDTGGSSQGSPNIVPNRNALLLSVAFAVAVVEQAQAVAFGIMADDVGPSDTSPEFLGAFIAMERVATRGYGHPELDLIAPLVDMHKDRVVALGNELEVPWADTWTCFRGGEVHCGECAACTERRGAFIKADVKDPTVYASPGC
jgi:7-cyano-7-deazaguanine synthase